MKKKIERDKKVCNLPQEPYRALHALNSHFIPYKSHLLLFGKDQATINTYMTKKYSKCT